MRVVLAVYHATPDVERHVAALRQAGRFKLSCYPQQPVAAARPVDACHAVLWELAPGRLPDRRRLVRLAQGVPVVSYSAHPGREVADLSRSIGFASHLNAPLCPVEVEHRLALVGGGDLGSRLAQLQPALRRRLQRVEAMGALVRRLGAALDPPQMAEILIAEVAEWIPAPAFGLFVAESAGDPRLLGSKALSGPLEPVAEAVARWVMREDEVFTTARADRDGRVSGAGLPAAVVAFPLACRGRMIGALVALDREPSATPPRLAGSSVRLLRLLFEAAATFVDDAVRIQRVEALSVTDDLTQLYNSRFLAQALRRETKRTIRSGRPVSLLFVDLDGFKSINDAHGHLFGSKALVEAAAVIRGSARETDVVARFGGDEFAVVLPETGVEGAVAVGERVRERIAAHDFLASEGLGIHLTASVGVATLPDAADSAEGLVQAADQAMYTVKDRGKNGIHVATG